MTHNFFEIIAVLSCDQRNSAEKRAGKFRIYTT